MHEYVFATKTELVYDVQLRTWYAIIGTTDSTPPTRNFLSPRALLPGLLDVVRLVLMSVHLRRGQRNLRLSFKGVFHSIYYHLRVFFTLYIVI